MKKKKARVVRPKTSKRVHAVQRPRTKPGLRRPIWPPASLSLGALLAMLFGARR